MIASCCRAPARLFPAALLTAALGLAACADRDSTSHASTPQYGGTVIIAANSDLENLNSLVAGERYTQEVNRYLLFLTLVDYGPDLDYRPVLAESWELIDDTAAVFRLRRDVRWHDGAPTTARDVVFTFLRARDPATAFPNAEYFKRWTGAVALDSFTVRFAFEPHYEPLSGLPFTPIMPAHLLDSIPPARMRQASFNRRPVGNGPFRFVEYRANDRWIFEANPDFPQALGGRPYIDRVVWRPIPEVSAQVAALTTGTADVLLTARPDDFARLSVQPGLRGMVPAARQYANVIWNHRVAPLNDPGVRRALTLAIDRQQIIETLRAGHGQVALGPIGPFHWAYDDSLDPLPYDQQAARALLAEAGITDRTGDGVLNLADGRPFQIELKIPAGSTVNRDMAELVRSNLAAVGVRITVRPVDFATMGQDIMSPERRFEAMILAWQSDFRINLRDLFHSGAQAGPYQFSSYSNPRVDSLIDGVAAPRNRAEAKPMYDEIQRILVAEQPWTFLYYYPDMVLLRDRVQDVEMDVRGALLNVARWWVTDPRVPAGVPAPGDSAGHSRAPDPAPAQ
jgi:peptide/nickel transport system substrate-binding protein